MVSYVLGGTLHTQPFSDASSEVFLKINRFVSSSIYALLLLRYLIIQNGKYYVELSLRKLISPLSAVRLGVTDFLAANEKKNYFFFHVLQFALRVP